MTGVLYGLANFCVRRRFIVIGVWLVLTVALVGISHSMGDNTSDDLSLPGTNSQEATNVLNKSFPNQANGSNPIVFKAPSGQKLTASKYSNAISQATSDVSKDKYVGSAISPLTSQGANQINKDQTIAYISVLLNVSPGSLSQQQMQDIVNKAYGPLQSVGLNPATGGQVGQAISHPATESSELVGIAAAAVILTLTFGTVTAMLLPIITAIFGLASALAIVRILGHVVTVPTVAPTLATMIGLGVGIDYALFIVTRHFRGLRDGLPMHESIARSAATSGGAVFFAGSTVTIALVSLAVAGIPLVTTMGFMAAIAVVIAVAAALTLLPAVLAILGPHINSLRVRHQPTEEQIRNGLWAKWAHEIAKYPIVAGLAALLILIPLAIPLFSLNLGQQDNAAMSKSTSIRQSYDLISQGFGAGVNGPLIVAVNLDNKPASSTSDSRLTSLQKDVANTKNVVAVTPIQLAKNGETAFFNAIPKYGPATNQTNAVVNDLRNTVIPKAESSNDLKAYVGGTTAASDDLASRISSKLPLQILVVIGLSFLLLILAFRTVVVPPQAAVMNLLSICASYGVLTAIFQYGWLHSLIGLQGKVPIVSYVPLFMFAILFGLSMDYEVFLVSQIEEHVHEGQDNRSSVVSGLVTSARVITAAACIMVFVFGSFLLNGNPTVKQFGLGLAVAVVLDATVVRCLLVPAVMIVVGKANWYMPRWMDKVVPHISIEGAEFFERRDKDAGRQPEPVAVGSAEG
jgi:RND superfamily putative drug exporter